MGSLLSLLARFITLRRLNFVNLRPPPSSMQNYQDSYESVDFNLRSLPFEFVLLGNVNYSLR